MYYTYMQTRVLYADMCTICRYVYYMQICVLYADTCTICRYVYYMQIRVLYAEVFLRLRVRYRGRPGNKAKVYYTIG